MNRVALLLIALALGSGLAVGQAEGPGPDTLLSELDGLDCVSGIYVGFSGVEGEFHRICRQLVELAVEGLPERLLASERPIRRAMGLALVVARDGKRAVPVLRERTDDRGFVYENAYGCVVSDSSVGAIARGLLGNRNWLGSYDPWEPLLSKAELLALDLEILGRDDTVKIHALVGGDVLDAIGKKTLPLDLAALRKQFPALSEVRLVKALGRLRGDDWFGDAQPDLDRWIRALAADGERPTPVRLAAASALALWSPTEDCESPDVFPEAAVTGLPEVDVVILRRDFAAVRELEKDGEKAAAFAAGHVLTLPRILEPLAEFDESEPAKALPEGHVAALMRLSERLDEWQAEWNVFGDGLYDLESAIARYGGRLETALGPERYALLTERVRQR